MVIATVTTGMAAAITFAFIDALPLAIAVGLPTTILAFAELNNRQKSTHLATSLLRLELVGLGVIWPSWFTIVALITLPSIFVSLKRLFKAPTAQAPMVEFYLQCSRFAANTCLLVEATHLAGQ